MAASRKAPSGSDFGATVWLVTGLQQVRVKLAASRARGETFAAAWGAVLHEMAPDPPPLRGHHTEAMNEYDALLATEPSWRAAYTGAASPTSEHAVECPPDVRDSVPHVTVHLPF
jgi:hypothetical protein